jgi:vacuolar-type H+-ATPase subunit H
LIKEAENILNAEIEKKRERQNEMLKESETKPRSRNPKKEERKQNFDPFVFHRKRK